MDLKEARKIYTPEEISDKELETLIDALEGVVTVILDEYLGFNESNMEESV